MPPEDPTAPNNSAADSDISTGESGSSKPRPLGLQRSDRGLGTSSSGFQRASTGLSSSSSGVQADVAQMVRQGLQELDAQRRELQREIEQLERRKERLETEMRTNFAGASQDIAIRVQGFKNYLVGSLQDLAIAAEEIDWGSPSKASASVESAAPAAPAPVDDEIIPLAAQRFAEQRDRIHSQLDQYRTRPDYYGPPWQLRRTFEPIHAERTSSWFFNQSGRGSIKSLGTRLQNVLVASATISCLYSIYGQRLCVLVLATTPERLGEWRRWLQDCLGIDRADFGSNRGVMLFEASEPMAQRAERLLESGRIPFLIMDEAEDKVSLSLLQFPLWLGFAPDPANPSTDYDYY